MTVQVEQWWNSSDVSASLWEENVWDVQRVGGGGGKWPKNWGERETATLELERILGRRYLTQVTVKKSDVAVMTRQFLSVGSGHFFRIVVRTDTTITQCCTV